MANAVKGEEQETHARSAWWRDAQMEPERKGKRTDAEGEDGDADKEAVGTHGVVAHRFRDGIDVRAKKVCSHDAREVIAHANDSQKRKKSSRPEAACVFWAGHRYGLRGSLTNTTRAIVPRDDPLRILLQSTVLGFGATANLLETRHGEGRIGRIGPGCRQEKNRAALGRGSQRVPGLTITRL